VTALQHSAGARRADRNFSKCWTSRCRDLPQRFSCSPLPEWPPYGA